MLQVMHQAHNGGPGSRGFFFLMGPTPSHPAFFFLMWYRSLVFFPTFLCYNQLRKEVFCMARFPDDIDIEIAKVWLAGQDLRSMTPEQAKEKFF